jgi:NitT/TauT family transport system ATP-binding protein
MKDYLVRLKDINKYFVTQKGAVVEALLGINLDVEKNEFVCILGPSGCGKSTLLRLIASLEKPSSGSVFYKDQLITQCHQEIGMVFQQYTLLPWRTIIDNVALGLEVSGIDRKNRLEKAGLFLEMVGLTNFAQSYPYELSGGMQQRVAIARSLANNPNLLLMDEPFGALDAHTRILLQRELLNIWEKNKKTIIFVTHSVDEALYLADKIIVMTKGPGKIKDIINVDMPRPRERSNPLFGEKTSMLLDMLEEEVQDYHKQMKNVY